MNLYDSQGRRLYLTADERRAFIAAAATADRPVRTLCTVLRDTGCRISEALALTSESIDLSGRAVMFESLKKRRPGISGPCRCRPPSSIPSIWSMASGRLRNAAADSPTARSGRGRATLRGGTSRP
jgi:integrase